MNKDKLITNTIIGAAMLLTAVVATKASAENSTPIKGTVMDYYSVVQDSKCSSIWYSP